MESRVKIDRPIITMSGINCFDKKENADAKNTHFFTGGLLTIILVILYIAQASANPDLAALSQGSVVQFTGTERISPPFAFNIEVIAPHPAVNFANLVGQPLELTVAPGRMVAGRRSPCRPINSALFFNANRHREWWMKWCLMIPADKRD